MTPQHQPAGRSRLSELENWMVPVLLGMILVVGSIRIFPWVKSKIIPAEQVEAVDLSDSPSINEPVDDQGNIIASIDTSNTEILSAEEKVVTEQRREQLAEILHQPQKPEPTLASIDTAAVSIEEANTLAAIIEPETPPAPAPAPTLKTTTEPAAATPNAPIAQTDTEAETLASTSITNEVAKDATALADQQAVAAISPKESIKQALVSWQVAWSSQNTSDYFAAYTDTYTDNKANRRTHKQWRDWRSTRVNKPDFIEIQVSDVAINLTNAEKASARFVQTYRAPNYQDKVVKRLGLINIDGSWKIQSETTLQVLPL